MEPLIHNQPEELDSLVMENELLRYEVTHLRARLAASQKAVRQARRASDRTESASTAFDTGGDDAARGDLVWLLRRLDDSPAGPLLRRRPAFRRLHEKYLREGDE